MSKPYNYLDLTSEQRKQADQLFYLIGKSLKDPLFEIHDDTVIAINSISEIYGKEHYKFCFRCRTYAPIDDELIHYDDCDKKLIYNYSDEETVVELSQLKTLREQFNDYKKKQKNDRSR